MQRFLWSVVICGLLATTAQAVWYDEFGTPQYIPHDPYLDDPRPITRGYQERPTVIIYAPIYTPPDPESAARAAILLRDDWAAYYQAQADAQYEQWLENQNKIAERRNAKYDLLNLKRANYLKRRGRPVRNLYTNPEQAGEVAVADAPFSDSSPVMDADPTLTPFGEAVQRVIDEADAEKR